MTRQQIRARIEEIGIIPAIRLSSAPDAVFAADAIAETGIPIVAVTMSVPGAVEVIAELARSRADFVVGAGTVFDVEIAQRCLDAGAHSLAERRGRPLQHGRLAEGDRIRGDAVLRRRRAQGRKRDRAGQGGRGAVTTHEHGRVSQVFAQARQCWNAVKEAFNPRGLASAAATLMKG